MPTRYFTPNQIIILFEAYTKFVYADEHEPWRKCAVAELVKVNMLESRAGDRNLYPTDRGRCLINYITSLPLPIQTYHMPIKD